MLCLRERFQSTGLQHSDPCVLYKSLCHLLDAATTFYLELFQITVLLGAILNCFSIIRIRYLYSELSGQVLSLHRRNSLRRTLYHLHNRETYPYSSKDNLDRYLVIYSQITFVPSCQICGKAHIRCGTQHGIPYRAYDKSIGDDIRPFSFFCRGRALSLNFIPYNSGKYSFFD